MLNQRNPQPMIVAAVPALPRRPSSVACFLLRRAEDDRSCSGIIRCAGTQEEDHEGNHAQVVVAARQAKGAGGHPQGSQRRGARFHHEEERAGGAAR